MKQDPLLQVTQATKAERVAEGDPHFDYSVSIPEGIAGTLGPRWCRCARGRSPDPRHGVVDGYRLHEPEWVWSTAVKIVDYVNKPYKKTREALGLQRVGETRWAGRRRSD